MAVPKQASMMVKNTEQKRHINTATSGDSLDIGFNVKSAKNNESAEKLTDNNIDFTQLLTPSIKRQLYQNITHTDLNRRSAEVIKICGNLDEQKKRWQHLQQLKATLTQQPHPTIPNISVYEHALTEWFINLFNKVFATQKVTLVSGGSEPDYLPAKAATPAQIRFAHNYFSSAVHEVCHWCIAGKKRRNLVDYGYWYAEDGRTQAQQVLFEQVEIKPQALECLFTLMMNMPFRVSQDNLLADFDPNISTFKDDVYQQVKYYIHKPAALPADAKTLLIALLFVCGA